MASQYIDNKKSKLLVCFSSRGRKNFDLYKILTEYKDFNVLFLSDEDDGFYNFAIPNFSNNIDQTKQKLDHLVSMHEYSIALGSSMGGYAAILFGIKCQFNKIISIAPQITLYPNFTLTTKKECEYYCLRKLIADGQADLTIYIGNNVEDIIQSHDLPNCHLRYIDTSLVAFGHNILGELKHHNILKSFLREAIEQPYSRISEPAPNYLVNLSDLKSFYDYFVSKKYKSALSYIAPLVQSINSPHLVYMAATCYFASNDKQNLLRAKECLLQKYRSSSVYEGLCIAIDMATNKSEDYLDRVNEENYQTIISLLSISPNNHKEALSVRHYAKEKRYSNANSPSNYYQIAMLYKSLNQLHDAIAYFSLAYELAGKSHWIKTSAKEHSNSLLNSL